MGSEADACPVVKHKTRIKMVFDGFGHPNRLQNGSSRDNRPSGRRGAANGRGVLAAVEKRFILASSRGFVRSGVGLGTGRLSSFPMAPAVGL